MQTGRLLGLSILGAVVALAFVGCNSAEDASGAASGGHARTKSANAPTLSMNGADKSPMKEAPKADNVQDADATKTVAGKPASAPAAAAGINGMGGMPGSGDAFSGGRSGAGPAASGGLFRPGGAPSFRGQMQPVTAAPPPAAKPTYNPNMYLGSNYVPGNGDKDRLEKLINEGVIVDGKRVKLESFPRDYAQAFPIPTQTALNVVADTERARIITQGDHTYLQIGLQAIKGEAPRRPPLNIALVIDRSGSMGDENKLEFAKAAANQLVDRLNSEDTFSLVVFDDSVNLLVPAQHVTNKSAVKRKIAGLTPGGGTNIFEGLTRGYEQARKFAAPNAVNRVILLSDGEVTAGVADPEQFHKLCASNVDNDIQTTSIGLGVEFNEDLMLAIARDGKGNYHFIKDGGDTQTVFAKELEQLTHIVAKDIKLRIRLADGIGFVQALGATKLDAAQTAQVKADEKKVDRKVYDELGISANRQNVKDEPGIKMIIPDFYRGDSHVVMLEITVPPGQGRRKIADVSLKYKDLVGKSNREAQVSASIDYTPAKADSIASINRSVKKNLLGFQTGQALSQAASLIAQGRVGEAAKQIDERMVVLGVAAKEWQDRDLDRDGQLLNRYKLVLADLNAHPGLERGEYGQYLAKSLTYNGYNMTR